MKPATPLPWTHDGIQTIDGPRHKDGYRQIAATAAGDGCRANAAFIVHACNNYGRLVEALREISKQAETVWVQANGLYDSTAARESMFKANALLRELGEL